MPGCCTRWCLCLRPCLRCGCVFAAAGCRRQHRTLMAQRSAGAVLQHLGLHARHHRHGCAKGGRGRGHGQGLPQSTRTTRNLTSRPEKPLARAEGRREGSAGVGWWWWWGRYGRSSLPLPSVVSYTRPIPSRPLNRPIALPAHRVEPAAGVQLPRGSRGNGEGTVCRSGAR
jgi:hypothetical protein